MDASVEAVERLLLSLARQGLQRLTESSEAEIRATAQRARFGGLIRVERQLEALATVAGRYRVRDPLFRTSQLASTLNRAWLLTRAVRRLRDAGVTPGVEILGELRRTYVEVEQPLEVRALSAAGWVTDSDFVGITVTVRAGEELLQIVNAKPTMYFGEQPERLLWQPLTAQVPHAIGELAHGAWTLTGARRSADGRLSLHQGLRVEPAPDQGRAAYAGIEAATWASIVDRLRESTVDPVGAGASALVYVEPRRWGPVTVDDTAAQLRQPLWDPTGARLWLQLPLASHTRLWVDNLQALARGDAPRPNAIVGEARIAGGELQLAPQTAVYFDAVELRGRPPRRVHEVHLGLESLERVRR